MNQKYIASYLKTKDITLERVKHDARLHKLSKPQFSMELFPVCYREEHAVYKRH